MINVSAIMAVARYEAKLLWRSWSFRIFSIIGLVVLVSTTIGIGATFSRSPHFLSALSSSLPLANIKMLNLYQGIIAAFLATEFFKRDRKHDTTQVIMTRSFSNTDYLLGKFMGIVFVFAALNIVVLVSTLILHLTISDSPFALMTYIVYPLVVGFPTLIFMIGISIFLITLIRNQAVVFILMLAYSLLVLIYLGKVWFNIFDAYAFYQPILFSDFLGFANLREIILMRGAYLLLGMGLLFATIFVSRRLSQSKAATGLMSGIGLVCLVSAAVMGTVYLQSKFAERAERVEMQNLSRTVVNQPTINIIDNDIALSWDNHTLTVQSKITAVNDSGLPLDSILLSLNPGLNITDVSLGNATARFRRDRHLIWLYSDQPMAPSDTLTLAITATGILDQNYCFLDIEKERFENALTAWLYRIPKQYAIVSERYVYLTPESGWYPVAGLSPGVAFPAAARTNFARFTLTANMSSDLVAISQGHLEKSNADGEIVCRFEPETVLPGISFMAGAYERKSIIVDSCEYALAYLPGHDYFAPYFDQIADTLPNLIREFRNEYEVALGLEYPFSRLTIVETPVEIYAYQRLWTTSMDIVQPEVLCITELGITGTGTDFSLMKRSSTRMQERSNQATSDIESQTWYLTNFVKMDILGSMTSRWNPREEENIETRTSIFPNYITFLTQVYSPRWPVINNALETYFFKRVEPPETKSWWDIGGMSDLDRANMALQQTPLKQLLTDTRLDIAIRQTALKNKGFFLLSLLESKSGNPEFAASLTEFVKSRKFRDISESELTDFLHSQGGIDFASIADKWYSDTTLPGYVIEDVDSYNVIEGERTKSQISFILSNPTDVEGIVKVSFRYQQQRANFTPGWLRGQEQYDYSENYYMAPQSSRLIAVLLDQPPALMALETFISRNIPGDITYMFRELKLQKTQRAYSSDSAFAYQDKTVTGSGEYLVDNEDAGFAVVTAVQQSLMRRKFTQWFDLDDMEDPYVRLRWWNPPGSWMPTASKEFYGKFVRSAFHKEASTGESKVAWQVTLGETSEYEVYFYYEGEDMMPFRPHRRGQGGPPRHEDAGEKEFLVFYEDGVDTVTIDLNTAEQGWNYIGTYRMLKGKSQIEMTDKNNKELVIADAVKWVEK